jgi:hypothetical protein
VKGDRGENNGDNESVACQKLKMYIGYAFLKASRTPEWFIDAKHEDS